MQHKYKTGQHVTVKRGPNVYKTKIIRTGTEYGLPVYDTADNHWCYEDQILEAQEAETVTIPREDAEKIAELLRGYYGALDNILYDRFRYEDLQKMLEDIDRLAIKLEG